MRTRLVVSLAAGMLLTPHFTAGELGVAVPEATDQVVANAKRTAEWLERARGILQVPLRVTSGFRTADHNAAIGGAPDSDHLSGLAADFAATGRTPFQVYQALRAAQDRRDVPPFDQLIFYAADDHVHVGLGAGMRGQVLVKLAEGSYVALAGTAVSKIRGYL